MTDGIATTTTATTTSDAVTPAAVTPPAGTTPAAPWYQGKIDPTVVGFWQNKGLKIDDPVAVAEGLSKHYREAEKFIGAPPDELIRIPKPNAAEVDVRSYWGRIGVPAEAKDYDLSAVKYTDGSELEAGFTDSIRAALHAGRVPKQFAPEVVKNLVKIEEAQAATELAEKTAIIQRETAALDKNWGTRKAINLVVAQNALQNLGAAAGLTAEQTKAAWDALSMVGGVGAASTMEMLRIIGARMGEAPYIGSETGGLNTGTMSEAQAWAEIDSLKKDRDFGARIQRGDAAAKRQWKNLHDIATASLRVGRVA